LIFIS